MGTIIGLIIGGIAGAIIMLFVLKNNPKYINFDVILKTFGKDQLLVLKEKIEKLLSMI
jgi:hypothetical protein